MIVLATFLRLKWAYKFLVFFLSFFLCLVISNADNSNFSKWDAFLGTSYMCQKEQTLEISDNIQIHTFNLWIQPFLVEENKFSTGKVLLLLILAMPAKFLLARKHQLWVLHME